MKNKSEILGKLTVTILLGAISWLTSGYLLIYLYEWFIIPTFQTPKISITTSLGILLILVFVKKFGNIRTEDKIDNEGTKGEKFLKNNTYTKIFKGFFSNISYKIILFVMAYLLFT